MRLPPLPTIVGYLAYGFAIGSAFVVAAGCRGCASRFEWACGLGLWEFSVTFGLPIMVPAAAVIAALARLVATRPVFIRRQNRLVAAALGLVVAFGLGTLVPWSQPFSFYI